MQYIDNIVLGVLIFPLIAAIVTFPYALYQYHKYGSVSKYRTLIIIPDLVLIALMVLCRGYFYAYFFCEVFRKEARPMPHDRLSGTKYISI